MVQDEFPHVNALLFQRFQVEAGHDLDVEDQEPKGDGLGAHGVHLVPLHPMRGNASRHGAWNVTGAREQ